MKTNNADNKIKTIIASITVKQLDDCPSWDVRKEYPKTVCHWRERVSDGAWCPYNDSFDNHVTEAKPDSFAEFCDKRRNREPINYMLQCGEALETSDSTMDRMVNMIHAYYTKEQGDGLNISREKWNADIASAEKDIAKAFNEAFDSLRSPGDVKILTFKDVHDDNRVTTITLAASADFFDLDDKTKLFMSEYWYKRWYDNNRRLGLIEFAYSFPAVAETTNGEKYADSPLADVIAAYDNRQDKTQSLDEWLKSKADTESEYGA